MVIGIQNMAEIGKWALSVTLEIDDPSTPIIDYSDSQLAHENENLPSETTLRFWLGEFDLQPGHVVTMYDDEVITTHIVNT